VHPLHEYPAFIRVFSVIMNIESTNSGAASKTSPGSKKIEEVWGIEISQQGPGAKPRRGVGAKAIPLGRAGEAPKADFP